MKKLYCLLSLLLFTTMVFAQWAQLPVPIVNKSEVQPKVSPKASFKSISKNNPVLFEDFQNGVPELPPGWATNMVEQHSSTNVPQGTFVNGFVTGNSDAANNGGYMPVPNISGNSFAYANDDGPPCNCGMNDVWLQTPEMDFGGLSNMSVSFNAWQDGNFGSGDWTVQASTNGVDWVTEFVSTALDDASPEWKEIVVPLFDYDDASQVWLRFQWSDGAMWATGFAVDNVSVDALFDYNLSLQEIFTADPNNPNLDNVVLEYTMVPLEQAVPMVVGASIRNNGGQPQTSVVLEATIYLDGAIQDVSTSASLALLPSFALDSIFIETEYTPTGTGEITVEITVSSDDADEDPTNNTGDESFEITDAVYARDDGSLTLFQDNGGLEYQVGTMFEIPVDGSECWGIAVAFGGGLTNPTDPGTLVHANLLNDALELIEESDDFIIPETTINQTGEGNFAIIPLLDPFPLEQGALYVVVLQHFGGSENVRVGTSGVGPDQTAFFQDEAGVWFYTNSIPMVRLLTDQVVGLDELDFHQGMKLLQNSPNPFNDHSFVRFELEKASLIEFQIHDINGKLLNSEKLGKMAAGKHIWQLNAEDMYPGVYYYTMKTDYGSLSERMIIIK